MHFCKDHREDIKSEFAMFVHIGLNKPVRTMILSLCECIEIEKETSMPYRVYNATRGFKDQRLDTFLLESNNDQIERLLRFLLKFDVDEMRLLEDLAQ